MGRTLIATVSGCKLHISGEIYLHFTLCIKLLGTEVSTAAVKKNDQREPTKCTFLLL